MLVINHRMVDFPIKNSDFPITNGGFPIKHGDFPIKNGDFPIKNCDFPIRNGDVPVCYVRPFTRPGDVTFLPIPWLVPGQGALSCQLRV